METKVITLSFDLGEVTNDVLAACNLISETLGDDVLADIKSSVNTPDGEETRSIVCRAVTEGWGGVKNACQRYLRKGRDADDNRLERLVKEVHTDEDTGEVSHIEYEKLELELYIPRFNTAVTDVLKSNIHQYMVSWVMAQFLKNLLPEKAKEYASETGSYKDEIVKNLNARESFTRRRAAWI